MRNLKKILALVLALVMSLSLMATAGAAQFPDVDDSNPYKTAIDVLDELKVFQGFEDGSFKPTDTLNRAQAAVLVYRIATGDVENKYLDNYTYMQQSKFTDLDGYNWAKGYINYCQNAGIVVGTSATTFNPGAQVTGYQLMVMLLRTLGYGKAGEFTDPKGWELQTAAIAEREGLLKNVTGGDFGAPAPRQMVAEILFRGLLHDTVAYSPLTPGGYTNSGETLGKKNLGLEDIKGVVMANEFADLEDDDTLADGKTRLDVDGKVYNLDIKSELTDIGEIRHAYVQNGTKVLTTLENLNDSVVNQPENGKASKVSDLSKVNGDTQYFKNFEPLESNTSEWRIEFNVEFVDNAALNITKEKAKADFEAAYGDVDYLKSVGNSEYKFTKSIKAGNEITPADLQIIKGIFDWADGEDINGADADINDGIKGSVYVGANSESSSNRNKNLAVEMTYKQFKAEYIDGTYTTISSSDNGEWLKTIDNNGDGVADYVFRTDFVMSVIADYNTKNETYYVEFDGETKRNVNSSIKKSAVVTEDELAVGDVILYTWIDGKCYVSHPEVDTAAIDKKGIDYKAKTITCGDTTYDWSGIEQEAYHYYHDVSEANVEVNYSLYKDHFGYVRLFAEANKGFVLLTDGFYATDLKKEHTYKAEIWDEAAKELAEVAVANDAFIDTDIDTGGKREEGTWDRLEAFEESYPAHVDGDLGLEYITTVASFDVNADGVYNLAEVESYSNRFAYTQHELDIASFDKGSVKDKDLKVTANHLDKNGNSADSRDLNRINATDETVYYYVQYEVNDKRQHNEIVDVTTWTGYKEGSVKLVDGDRAYAVTRAYREADDSDWVNYETAEIIVIEHEVTGKTNVVFPVTLSQRLIGTRNQVGGSGFVWGDESGKWSLDDFTGKYADQISETVKSVDSNNIAPVDISDLLHFYEKDGDGKLIRIDGNFAKHNIYAGVIVTEIGTVSRSYGEIGLARGSADLDPDDIAPKHDFYKASDNFYTIGYDRDSATEKDEMLHIPGHQYDWLYGDVSSTFEANGLDAADMNRGDLVLYVTDGDGAVQAVINVTESRMDKSYDGSTADGSFPGVYNGDGHTTWDMYEETYTLLTLWKDIADEQGAVVPTNAPVVKFYGVEDNQAGDTNSTVGTITVSHATAKAATNANFLTVEGGNWTITPAAPESTDAVSTSAQTWTLSIYGDNEQWYTYTLVLNAQSGLGKLITKENTYGLDIKYPDAPAKPILNYTSANATLSLLEYYLTCTNAPDSWVKSVKGFIGPIEKNADDKLTEMDKIVVVVTNKDGAEETYTFQTSDSTLPTAPIALSTLTLANNVKAYNLASGVEYKTGDQMPAGTPVRFVYPVAYADADAPNKATPFLVNSVGTAADGRDADGMLFIVREVGGGNYSVGFNTATKKDGTFTFTPDANKIIMVPNSGATAVAGHDADFFLYVKPGNSWHDIGIDDLTATGVTNWFTVAAGAAATDSTKPIQFAWTDDGRGYDEGIFTYWQEGENGGELYQQTYELWSLQATAFPTEVTKIKNAVVNNTAHTVTVGAGEITTADIVFDVAGFDASQVEFFAADGTTSLGDTIAVAAGSTVSVKIQVTAADGIQTWMTTDAIAITGA